MVWVTDYSQNSMSTNSIGVLQRHECVQPYELWIQLGINELDNYTLILHKCMQLQVGAKRDL